MNSAKCIILAVCFSLLPLLNGCKKVVYVAEPIPTSIFFNGILYTGNCDFHYGIPGNSLTGATFSFFGKNYVGDTLTAFIYSPVEPGIASFDSVANCAGCAQAVVSLISKGNTFKYVSRQGNITADEYGNTGLNASFTGAFFYPPDSNIQNTSSAPWPGAGQEVYATGIFSCP